MKNKRPLIGVGVCIIKDDKVLLGKRKGAHGAGTWSFPGGHLEFMENWNVCAIRETNEECDIEINNIRFWTATNDIFKKENKHYNTIFLMADYVKGNPELKEPDKCEKWEWFKWDNLPKNLFLPIQNLLKKNLTPF